MKAHDQLRDDDHDRAAQYVLDALEPDAALLYEAHLEICPPCRADVLAFRETLELLGRSVSPVDPPLALKDRLMERIRRGARGDDDVLVQAWKRWRTNERGEKSFIVRGSDGDWQTTAIEGVRVRRLAVDEAADRVTMLVRMDARTTYPAHRHAGVEECFVLEGDIYGPDFEMQAGDYQRLAGGSTHGIQGTRAGCLLFIVSSMNDELIPHDA